MSEADAPTRAIKHDGRRRRLFVGIVIVAVAAALVWLTHAIILRDVADAWVVSDELAHADAIVVLGGGIEVRPFAAAALYKDGLADTILLSEVQKGRAERLGFIPSHTELNREVLLKLGVPAAAIATVGKDNTSTFEEAEAVRAWAVQSRAKSVIIPTDLFAARRTRWIFARELNPSGVTVMVRAFRPPDYGLADWWRTRHGLVDFNNELLKYVYYRLAN